MPMIPLSHVLALVLGYFLLIELTRTPPRNRFACAFLILLIVQFVIVGLRFGYGVEALGIVFSIGAALLGPLAFLSFQNPSSIFEARSWPLLVHLLPLSAAIILCVFAHQYIDLAQGLFMLVYAVALTVLGLRERDTFPWVDFNQREYVRRALWCVVALAFISACTDFIIAFDSWHSRGANIPRIVGWAAVLCTVLFILYACWLKLRSGRSRVNTDMPVAESDPLAEIELLTRLEKLIETTQLHLDPDLNLNRMARKLGVPARQVSNAVNRQKSISVSQYINGLRIDEACCLLRDTDLPVTRVMLQAGFVTKSNFNREFGRRLGMSPSAWRNRK